MITLKLRSIVWLVLLLTTVAITSGCVSSAQDKKVVDPLSAHSAVATTKPLPASLKMTILPSGGQGGKNIHFTTRLQVEPQLNKSENNE